MSRANNTNHVRSGRSRRLEVTSTVIDRPSLHSAGPSTRERPVTPLVFPAATANAWRRPPSFCSSTPPSTTPAPSEGSRRSTSNPTNSAMLKPNTVSAAGLANPIFPDSSQKRTASGEVSQRLR